MAKKEKTIRGKYIKKPVTRGTARVPVVMQLEALECGAACLAMVMAYYGKWVPLEQVRLDCGVSRDGSNARSMLIAARSYGFTAKAYRCEPETLCRNGYFPCIIHWNFNHFVVLDGFKNGKAVLNDPAGGNITVSMEVFDRSFTGFCMMIEPAEGFTPSGKPKSILAFVKKRLRGTRSVAVFSVLTSILTALTGIIGPVFSLVFTDRLLTHKSPAWFGPFIIGLCVFSGVQLALAAANALYRSRLSGKLAAIGSTGFLWKVLHLPVAFFSQRLAGDIQSRQSSSEGIAENLVNTLAPLVLNSGMMVFYLVVMLRYSWQLTVVGIFSLVLNALMAGVISKQRINITRVQQRELGKLQSTTVAGIELIETIKSSGAENGFFEKWAGYQAGVNSQSVRQTKIDQYLGLIPSAVSVLTNAIVLAMGIWFTIQGNFTVGMITAFQGFLSSFFSPAAKLISAGQTIQEMRTRMERVEDVMEYPEDACYAAPAEPDSFSKLSGSIEMKDVSFGYARLARPVISHINLKLTPGQCVAFVGMTGCGKSTVAKLLAGLYQPWEGKILFDGKPASEINRDVFTGSVAVVDQEIVLFEDTIANNIKMWDTSIEDFEMILAARDAQLHDDIMQRRGGYHYRLTENGKDLSGGQRQRLEIARVLAQDPTIVILDEATSALDAKTEHDVVKAIRDRGITMIIIAHRLSTIRDCDEILVMDKGEVIERGTHQELYRLGGRYTELVSND